MDSVDTAEHIVGVVRPDRTRQRIPLPVDARPGPAAPWADLPAADRHIDTATVREAFRDLAPPVPSPREREVGLPASAVLAPLYDEDGDANVILTRRHLQLRAHSGEVSFPGGRSEPGETLEQTARREAQEEIALRSPVEVIGELDHLSTITSGSFIVPYVGVLPEPPVGLVANPGEVEAILTVRVSDLLDPDVYRSEIWNVPGRGEFSVVFFDLDDDTVWGATAAMLRQLLGFVTGTVGRGELGHI
jgi:8-oxo-dGTP pyrophosphatase MutT (NUDIX family)